jgi:hypothetical protein
MQAVAIAAKGHKWHKNFLHAKSREMARKGKAGGARLPRLFAAEKLEQNLPPHRRAVTRPHSALKFATIA